MVVVRKVLDYEALSDNAARFIADCIREKPVLRLGLAAGNTPLGTYRELVRMHRDQGLDFSRVVFFNLDEYSDSQSFTDFLNRNLLDQIDVNRANVHLIKFPNSESYEVEIRDSGGIDLQILGIGVNGHIAFNEPGSSFASRTRIVTVASDAQKTAITMGIATILESRRILLLASGEAKAEILAAALEGPVTEDLPASVLQRHPDVIVIADDACSARLRTPGGQ
jgi:glucosamine-6-phosphate deaminase